MSLSRATIPSVTYNMEADFTALMEFREKIKAEGAKKGVKISYSHILMKICAAAVKEVPLANASFDGDAIVLHGNVNMGIAVSVNGIFLFRKRKQRSSENPAGGRGRSTSLVTGQVQ